MTKSKLLRRSLLVPLALTFQVLVGVSAQNTSPSPQNLGQLQITVSKVEQYTMVGDTFDGRTTSYSRFGCIYLHFKNVGNFPVCVSLTPFVEEFKGSQLQYTQPLKTGFAYSPTIENLKPGGESSGFYDFRPSPQKRTYVLVLREQGPMQACDERSKSKNATTSDGPSVRFRLSGNTKPH